MSPENLDPELSHIVVPLLVLYMRTDGVFSQGTRITLARMRFYHPTHDGWSQSDAPSGEWVYQPLVVYL